MAEQLEDNDDIYIDCRPVDTKGEDADSNVIQGNQVMNDMTFSYTSGSLTENVGFQTLLGITLLAILYGIGDYVFKQMPKKILEKKLMRS